MSLNFDPSFIHSRDWLWSEIAGMQIWQASKLALSRKVTDNHSISLPIHARKQVVLSQIFCHIGIDHPSSTLTGAGLALTLYKNAGMQTLTKLPSIYSMRRMKRDEVRGERGRMSAVTWVRECDPTLREKQRTESV